MTKFDKCILHIGITKTGTKSLQEFLGTNRLVLAKKGILYPRAFGEYNHVKLAQQSWNFHKLDRVRVKFGIVPARFIRAGLTSKDLLKDFRKEILSSFQKEIQNTDCTKLLISAEALAGLTKIEDIQFLKIFLNDFAGIIFCREITQ